MDFHHSFNRRNLFAMLWILSFTILGACGGDDNPVNPDTGNDAITGSLTVQIGGEFVDFSENCSARLLNNGYFIASSEPDLGYNIGISFPSSPGTYGMSPVGECNVSISLIRHVSVIASRTGGTLVFSSITNNHLIGSFSGPFGDGNEEYVVSGTFDVPMGNGLLQEPGDVSHDFWSDRRTGLTGATERAE